MHKLTATAVSNAKPGTKNHNLSDGGGLYLLVKPNGTKAWRFNYRFTGKQKTLAIGVFPDISLKAAREKHRVDFPEFARHQIALESNSRRGVYEGQTIYRRV